MAPPRTDQRHPPPHPAQHRPNRRRPWRRHSPTLVLIGAATLTAVILTPLLGPSQAPPPTDAPAPHRVLSRYETAAHGNHINRDCGFSIPHPGRDGHALWLFCDTIWNGTDRGLWLGSTAATGPYRPGHVPTALTELPPPPAPPPTEPGAHPPQGMLRPPPGMVLPPGAPCTIPDTAYSASWIAGAAKRPGTSTLLITYTDVCVRGNTISPQGFGVVEYHPDTNALGSQTRVFAAPTGLPFQHNLGSPIFAGDHLYLYGFTCDHKALGTCETGRVTLARVNARPGDWTNPAAYTYWTPRGWTPDASQARTLIHGAAPAGIHVADYTAAGKGYALIEQHGVGADFRVWHAPTPAGPWKPGRRSAVPCGGQSGVDLCRAFIGHPELSTPEHLLMSYYNPADDHISVTAVPW